MSKQLETYSFEKEGGIRKFWKDNKIPEKVKEHSAKQKNNYFFMDGPPYASGHIHMGTALNKILKDVTIRHKRMQGFHVLDQPGYDTHGVPIEVQVEKELGFDNKKQIEDFGIEKFVEKCREFATQYIDVMNEEFENLGVWMDWEKPYLTLDNQFIEAMWFTFKKAEDQKLLYLGKYPVHVCPRCETAVAYNEVEYIKQTDTSVYVKFPVQYEKNKFLIIWTTTPWTLPGNTGVMAHPTYTYVEAEVGGETWILAKERLQELMDSIEAGFTIKREFLGQELDGLLYHNPLGKNLKLKKEDLEKAYKVIMSERYVNLEEGTGLVHTAPGHGKEDFEAGKEAGLPAISPVQLNGLLTEEAGKYSGKKAREVDKEIIEDMEKDKALLYKHNYTHDYPVCWRCKTPLLMISTPQWFFKVGSFHDKLLKMNEEVNWFPTWGKDRFRNWLENIGDWPVSRARYWGTPLPIWECKKCDQRKVVGSLGELKKLSGSEKDVDLHRPYIDKVTLPCKCSGEMERVKEVMDVWIDSGVASWGSIGYPSQNEKFKRFWPADVNIEGKDQIRGWWNSQLITSAICFGKKPFKSIVMHGMVLDVKKDKMSKSKGNIVTPKEVIEKYNRDFLRFYLIGESKGEDLVFSWDSFKEIARFFNVLWNTYNFAALYLDINPENADNIKAQLEVEDRWILSRFHRVLKTVLGNYNNYQYFKNTQLLEKFVLEDLSRTYIKLVRDRIGKESGNAVREVLGYCLYNVMKLLAPVTPHLSEAIYQNFRTKNMSVSVHLLNLPQVNEKMINNELEKNMDNVQEIAQGVLSLRENNKLRLRWKLKSLIITGEENLGESVKALGKMVNVKEVKVEKTAPKGKFAMKEIGKFKAYLNLEEDKELKEEWELAELTRKIQDLRKKEKLNPHKIIPLELGSSDKEFLEKYKDNIEDATNTKIEIKEGEMEKLLEREFYISLKK